MRWTLADHTADARRSYEEDVMFAVLADRRSHLNRHGMIRPKVLVVFRDHAAVHRSRLRGGIGQLVETFPVRALALDEGRHPLECEIDFDGDRWFVHGWFECDLKVAIEQLFPSTGASE